MDHGQRVKTVFGHGVVGIPTGGTFIPRDISVGIHKTRGYSYHCDTGFTQWQMRHMPRAPRLPGPRDLG
jgi:hypothetical protein